MTQPILTEAPTLPEHSDKKMCGIVMPMSASGEYTEKHWNQIRAIIEDAAESAGFSARIVSTNSSQAILQSNLVNNLYEDEVVVCDLSNNNPNVMIELGMRIAFGKPFILIKDRVTKFSSDIGLIIHELYDNDMLYPDMKLFREKLSALIREQVEDSKKPSYKSFISTFKTPEINFDDISSPEINMKQVFSEMLDFINKVKSNESPLILNRFSEDYPLLSQEDKAFIKFFLTDHAARKTTSGPILLNHRIHEMLEYFSILGKSTTNGLYAEIERYANTLGLGPFINAA